MSASLLTTKLHFPQIHSNLVPRLRLIRILEHGLTNSLTLISAPAGSGKTTLMGEWQKSTRHPIPVAWLSLDSADNDPFRFLTYLTAALQSVAPDLVCQTVDLFEASQPPAIEFLISSLVESLNALTSELVLALDDYHVITNIAIHSILNNLVAHLAPAFHLVILTRADPPLPLARLRVRDQLTEIRARDLRFTVEEVAEFLSHTMGLSLSQEQASLLEAQTEGWIAGVQLAALSAQGRGDANHFIAAFTGSNRYIVDYLVDEVLAVQSEKTRDFLLKTSVLERMNAALCNALTDNIDSQSMLEELERANLFVVPLDQERQWYRYHHLFADVLRGRLARLNAEHMHELQCLASQWCAQHGLIEESITYAFMAQDFEHAADLIEQCAQAMSMSGRVETLSRWIETIPADITARHPKLGLANVWSIYFEYKFDEAEAQLNQVEQNLSAADASLYSSEIILWHGIFARRHGELKESERLLSLALQQWSEEESPLLGRAWIFLGLVFLEKDMTKAHSAFLRARDINEAHKNITGELAASYFLAWTQMMQGMVEQASIICQSALACAARVPQWPVASYAHLAMAELLYERNRLAEAMEYLKTAMKLAQSGGHADNAFIAALNTARVERASENWIEAESLIKRAEQLALPTVLYVREQVIEEKVHLFWMQGKKEELIEILQNKPLTTDISLFPSALSRINRARCYLALHELAHASSELSGLLKEVDKAGMQRLKVQVQCLQAMILESQNCKAEALEVFEQALFLAQERGFVRTILDEGLRVITLLRRVKAECNELKIYADKLLIASDTARVPHASLPPSQALIDPLSEREMQVLRMIAAGAPNKKIANELFIAIGTVKRHTVNIFNKLGVENRTEAVAKARELEIL